jgi:hypothetical protein
MRSASNSKLTPPQILQFGRVMRPYLGVALAPSTLAQRLGLEGVIVLGVAPGGPAAAAGLKPSSRWGAWGAWAAWSRSGAWGRCGMSAAPGPLSESPCCGRLLTIPCLRRRRPAPRLEPHLPSSTNPRARPQRPP